MKVIQAILTNRAYGYPRGATRRHVPYVLAVLHQTSNANATARQERDHANRAGSNGPSATYYVDRDGTAVHAVDGTRFASWGAGDVNHPDTKIATVARFVREHVNPNEVAWEQIEVCGAGSEPYTAAQFETVAQLVAARSKASGLPISRSTVLAHRDIDTVNRPSDPWPAAHREAHMATIIARAKAILKPPAPPKPKPAIVNHTVVSGDTLGGIAQAHGLTLAKLLAFAQNARYRANPGLIHVGDVVRVK